ncbi:MAG: hypothetical protein ABI418_18660 [Jatrophihabitantaceae bacterium]
MTELSSDVVPRVELLVPGDRAAILLVDFAFSSEGVLRAALGEPVAGHSVSRLDPVAALADLPDVAELPGLEELAAGYARRIAGDVGEPAVFIGYCGAARLAVAVVDELARLNGYRAGLLLVEPTWVEPGLIRLDLAEALVRLGGDAGVAAEVELTLPAVLGVLGDAVETRLRDAGVEAEEIEMTRELLLERYRGFFGFLLATAAAAIEPAQPVRSCTRSELREVALALAESAVIR